MSIVNAHTVGLLCPGLHCYYLWEYRSSNAGVLLVPIFFKLFKFNEQFNGSSKISFIKNDGHPNTVVHKCACNYLVP